MKPISTDYIGYNGILMADHYPDSLWQRFACPHCLHPLSQRQMDAYCSHCDIIYAYSPTGSLDLRLQGEKQVQVPFRLNTPLLPQGGFDFSPLSFAADPQVDFAGMRVPRHLTPELLGAIPRAAKADSLALDLGCGDASHRQVCEHAGFTYVGLDYESANAPLLGDAHALPFLDESFDFILTIAVVEHLRFPHLMMRESWRVLKPGGKIVGTAAFLEPFHSSSLSHHSHLGLYDLLNMAGFKVRSLGPNPHWQGLIAQAQNGLFPAMPRRLASALVAPLLLLHRLWWWAGALRSGKPNETRRLLTNAGSFTFVAEKTA